MGKVVVPVRTRMVTSTLAHANGYPPPLFGHRCPASGGIYDGDAGGTAMDWQDIPLILNHHYVKQYCYYRVSATTGLRRIPIPGISTSHTSPTFMFCGKPSVPIQMTSPG